ncbi:hypothetical protein KTR66_23095 [Roseococcus sp. SDR]|uniref:hypothetical protein n=1 Tax=Roseococcus sp. SDR TaxID=2835532 RepID=UPI001BD0B185|nr:hypothetical protein [Roseococcus sp. SDR]MBS7792895.1 hypothetical protein [Roseococcus sp. SDR]MBV1848209.1 hypothetical protein [Roseococcus sp. SDR]
MSEQIPPASVPFGATIFTDGLLDASVQHGVVRLTLGRLGADNKPVPAGMLVIPLVQLGGLTQGLGRLMQQIEAKIKEAAPAAPETPPDSFTFGGR